jgi:hypothetical protein
VSAVNGRRPVTTQGFNALFALATRGRQENNKNKRKETTKQNKQQKTTLKIIHFCFLFSFLHSHVLFSCLPTFFADQTKRFSFAFLLPLQHFPTLRTYFPLGIMGFCVRRYGSVLFCFLQPPSKWPRFPLFPRFSMAPRSEPAQGGEAVTLYYYAFTLFLSFLFLYVTVHVASCRPL